MGYTKPKPEPGTGVEKSNRGRPTKLTPEIQKNIVSAVAAGNYMETAASFAGIGRDTFFDWMKRGARERQRREGGLEPIEDESIYVDFSNSLEIAFAQAEVQDLAVIGMAAARGEWTAAAWRLERKFPARYGKFNRVEVTGGGGGPIKTVVEHYDLTRITDPAKLQQLRELLSEASGSEEDEDVVIEGDASEC